VVIPSPCPLPPEGVITARGELVPKFKTLLCRVCTTCQAGKEGSAARRAGRTGSLSLRSFPVRRRARPGGHRLSSFTRGFWSPQSGHLNMLHRPPSVCACHPSVFFPLLPPPGTLRSPQTQRKQPSAALLGGGTCFFRPPLPPTWGE